MCVCVCVRLLLPFGHDDSKEQKLMLFQENHILTMTLPVGLALILNDPK